jgi:hypothetical protein
VGIQVAHIPDYIPWEGFLLTDARAAVLVTLESDSSGWTVTPPFIAFVCLFVCLFAVCEYMSNNARKSLISRNTGSECASFYFFGKNFGAINPVSALICSIR